MSHYHLSVKPLSRSKGRSAPAAAAYRAGKLHGGRLYDIRNGVSYDYSRKGGVVSADIVIPASLGVAHDTPFWALSRGGLWNMAEAAENRKDACTAREVEVALPASLDEVQRRLLALRFAQAMADEEGCAVDVCIHAPGRGGDHRNHHAHMLRTTRKVMSDGFGEKLATEKAGRNRAADLSKLRELWATLSNESLQLAGLDERVSHLSFKDRGLEQPPTKHLGVNAVAYERRTAEKSRRTLDHEAEVVSTEHEKEETRAIERALQATKTEIRELDNQRTQERWERGKAAMAAAEEQRQAKTLAALSNRPISFPEAAQPPTVEASVAAPAPAHAQALPRGRVYSNEKRDTERSYIKYFTRGWQQAREKQRAKIIAWKARFEQLRSHDFRQYVTSFQEQFSAKSRELAVTRAELTARALQLQADDQASAKWQEQNAAALQGIEIQKRLEELEKKKHEREGPSGP